MRYAGWECRARRKSAGKADTCDLGLHIRLTTAVKWGTRDEENPCAGPSLNLAYFRSRFLKSNAFRS